MDIRAAMAFVTTAIILYRLRMIQNAISTIASASPTRENIPAQYQELTNYFQSPEAVTGLIKGTHTSVDQPGQYGLPYKQVLGINGTKVPVYGNISNLYT